MATTKEVYDSICESIQKHIEVLSNEDINLTEEQISDIIGKIGKLNKQLEEYSKRFMR